MVKSARYTLLVTATFAVSWAAIFIRMADANPISIAFYRMAIAVIFLAPFTLQGLKKSLFARSTSDIILLILSGVALGFHFASWIASLSYTTIANSIVIVSTQPFFVAIAEAVIFRARISKRAIIGMVIAFFGVILMSGIGFDFQIHNLFGEFLALIGAVCAGAYFMMGRKLRHNMDNRHYIVVVYAIAAISLLFMALLSNAPLVSFSGKTWSLFALLALVPTIIGHSLFNYLLKFYRAHQIGLTILGEPIGTIALAIIIFGEFPTPLAFFGSICVLIGIFLALTAKKSDDKRLETA